MPTEAFHEILLEGNADRCQGLVHGLAIGSGSDAFLAFSQDAGIRTPMRERILEIAHLHAAVCHVVADNAGRELITRFAAALEQEEIRLVGDRPIASARFQYRFHAYARRYAQEIHDLLADLPDTLRHDHEEPKETVVEGATGMEAYTPVHDYEVEGEGVVSGARVDQIVEARERLNAHPLVKVEEIELELAGD